MAVYLWSTLVSGRVISPFNARTDVLRFDDPGISAASVTVAGLSNATSYAVPGKSVGLALPLYAITTTNVTFANGSKLIVGDNLRSTAFDDTGGMITGGAGNDQLIAGAGGYELFGLGGNDLLIGGADDDLLDGGAGSDRMRGGAGDDTYIVNSTGDVITELAGQGFDLALSSVSHTLSANVEVLELTGTAALNGSGNSADNEIYGNDAANTLSGAGGDDYLEGRGGNDRLIGGLGADSMDGGDGFDYASYSTATAGVTVDLSSDIANTGDAAGDEFGDIEGVLGSAFADSLYGDDADNDLQGLGGNDLLIGGEGNDTLSGGAGSDTLDGALGLDILIGGSGNDTFRFETDEANGDTVIAFNGNGALAGDQLIFSGYGTAADGATFIQLDATHWQISSDDASLQEILTFTSSAAIHSSDYTFI